MSILKVARMGHPALRQRGRPLDRADLQTPHVQKLIDDMIDTMREYSGVGLAAPQVHEGLRLFVALLDEEPDDETAASVIVNPEIVPDTPAREEGWEGCLSIPDIRGLVPRFTDITVRALDRGGRPLELHLKGFAARVVQHEADHLDGVLFFDRMTSMQSLTFLDEYSRFHSSDRD
ncbi:MAG: peptide deformylase [Acidobacteria bacterium RIFCSPLOWO2_02_FULL_67_21]|nr:MAG: peptide deformylase [Acidobacteria bacterium RIFCSPLOWO2_02_FULL_67_21]